MYRVSLVDFEKSLCRILVPDWWLPEMLQADLEILMYRKGGLNARALSEDLTVVSRGVC
jgi:hypothetical protein